MAGGAKSKALTSTAVHKAEQRARAGAHSEAATPAGSSASLHHLAGNRAVASLFASAQPSPLASEARPLEPGLRAAMESRFGTDLSGVRIHAGEGAADLAKSRRARAYAQGQNIIFGAGQFSPYRPDGRGLLAHELAHVMQQSRPGGVAARQAHEREAEAAANLAGVSGPISVDLASIPGAVQCSPLDENSVLQLNNPTEPKSPP